MANPIVQLERSWIEFELTRLCEMLEKQKTEIGETQHLRGQITTFRKILRQVDEPSKRPESKPTVAIY